MKKNQKLRRQNRYGDPIDMKIILNEKKAPAPFLWSRGFYFHENNFYKYSEKVDSLFIFR
jgi:hypothetical protein